MHNVFYIDHRHGIERLDNAQFHVTQTIFKNYIILSLINNINTYVPVFKIISVYRCIIGSQFNMN